MPLVRFQAPKRHIFYTGEGTLEPSTYKRKFNVALYVGTDSLNISYLVHGPGHLRCTTKRDQLGGIHI